MTDEDYLKKRQRYDEWRTELLTYLSEKNDDFMDAADGISYIPEPKDEDDRRVNAWLDYINDYQDTISSWRRERDYLVGSRGILTRPS